MARRNGAGDRHCDCAWKNLKTPRYYKRVSVARTTTSRARGTSATRAVAGSIVSIVALSLAVARPARAQAPAEPSIFPLEQRWAVAIAAQASAPPLVDDGRAFVALESGEVAAFALADGAPLWSAAIESAFPLAVGEGLVFVAAPEAVVALDQTTGAERWRTLGVAAAAAPTWHAGWLLAATGAPEIVALRAVDGAVIWREGLDGRPSGSAAIEGDRVYLPLEDGRVLARQIASGAPVWETRLAGAGRGIVALADRIYVGSIDNRFYCLAARDGRTLWNWRTGADVIGGAVVDAERVYFVSLDNALYALDRQSGVRRWKTPLPTRAVRPPSPAGRAVLVPVSGRTLLFAPRGRGRPMAQVMLPADLFTASEFDAARDVMVVTVTVDAGGRAELQGFGHAPPLPLEPLAAPPGLGIGRPVPLVTTELPFRLLALPALPRRGG